jgi:hypothetical protein
MYHLVKMSRMYSGFPYCGPTSDYKPAQYETLEEALAAKKAFTEINPVGWDIYDTVTGREVSPTVQTVMARVYELIQEINVG